MIRRTTRFALEMLIVAVAAVISFAVVMTWRLSEGPVSLEFVTPWVSEALAVASGEWKVELDNTVLVWSRERESLEIHALGVRAMDAEGDVIVSAPAVSMGFSVPAMLRGVVAPTRLIVIGPRVRLARAEDGSISLGIRATSDGEEGGEGAPADSAPPITLRSLVAPADPDSPLASLQEIRIVDADFRVTDEFLGMSWRAPGSNFRLLRTPGGVTSEAELNIRGFGEDTRVNAVGIYDLDSDRLTVAVGFAGLEPALIAGGSERLAALAPVRLVLDGNIRMLADGDGVIEGLDIEIRRGVGQIEMAEGSIPDLEVVGLRAEISVTSDLENLQLGEFLLTMADGVSIEASGAATGLSGDMTAGVTLAVRNLELAGVDRYWPAGMAEGARSWVLENVVRGTISTVRVGLAASGGDGDPDNIEITGMQGAMLFEGLEVNYVPGLPPAVALAGDGTFDLEGFVFNIREGRLDELRLSESVVVITGLATETEVATINVGLHGELREALRILDLEPLGYPTEMGIEPAAVSGRTSMQTRFVVPLIQDLRFDQVEMGVTARVDGLAWEKGLLDRDFSDGSFDLELDPRSMTVRGQVIYADMPIDVVWHEYFSGRPEQREVVGETVTDVAHASTFGFDMTRWAAGDMPVSFNYVHRRDGGATIDFEADLGMVTTGIPALSWEKAAGQPGTVDFSLVLEDNVLAGLRNVDLRSEGLTASGSVGFDPVTGDLNSAEVARLAFGRTDLAAEGSIGADGYWEASITGAALDISGLLDSGDGDDDPVESEAEDGDEDFTFPPMRVSAVVDRLYTRPERYLTDLALQTTFDGEDWRAISFRGRMTHSTTGLDPAELTVELFPDESDRRILEVRSADAGALAWTVGVSDSVVGGDFEIGGYIDDTEPEQPLHATILIEDYALFEAPVMARVLTLASLTGIVDVLSGDGLGFGVLEVPLIKRGDIVEVENARAVGSQLGLTMHGWIDLANDEVHLGGTIVPAYTLNSLLGYIPLLGEVLVGEEGSGIFAAGYTVEGPIDDPEVSVNPLAALTPGFLRNIFGGPEAPPEPGVDRNRQPYADTTPSRELR